MKSNYLQGKDSSTDGFRTILSGLIIHFILQFLPNGGHDLFMDVKICELQGLLNSIENDEPMAKFYDGLAIEKVIKIFAINKNGKVLNIKFAMQIIIKYYRYYNWCTQGLDFQLHPLEWL